MNNEIWNKILLKFINGSEFVHAATPLEPTRKYQVFEVLVAETLARIQPEMNWQVTVGSGDNGVDLIASITNYCKTPFIEQTIEQLVLGQVKRRSEGYRYDEFRNNITSAFEHYTSTYISNGKSLLELVFVISTDNTTNIENLKTNLANEFIDIKRYIFVANMRSPVHIIDANELIKYWKYNFNFIQRLISPFIESEQLRDFKNYLNAIENDFIQVSAVKKSISKIGEMVELPITIQATAYTLPLELTLKWTPDASTASQIQLLKPLELLTFHKGINVRFIQKYCFSISIRALSEGEYDLGTLELFTQEGILVSSFHFGKMEFIKNLMPIMQSTPNKDIAKIIYADIVNHASKYICFGILGSGGIGKSYLINELVIRLSNQGYLCIGMQHLHNFAADEDFVRELISRLVSSQMHTPCLDSEIKKQTILFLNHYFVKEWLPDVEHFFNQEENYSFTVIASLLVTLIIKISLDRPLIIWLSDLHWLGEPGTKILKSAIHMLVRNHNYLSFPVRFILEGRKDESIVFNNKTYFPYLWNEFLTQIKISKYTLKLWSEKESEKFISSLLLLSEHKQDYKLYEKLYQHLLRSTSGVPMHITVQIQFLLQNEKLQLSRTGQLRIIDPEWDGLISFELKELVQNRLCFFCRQYPDYGDFIIIYAKLESIASDALKRFICRYIQRNIDCAEKIALESDFFNLSNDSIKFQHEYYSEKLKEMEIQAEQSRLPVLKWIESSSFLSSGEKLSEIELLNLADNPDYKIIIKKSLELMKQSKDDKILLSIYQILSTISDEILNDVGLHNYEIYYQLSKYIMRIGHYLLAEEYLVKIISMHSRDVNYFYYQALAYQQLSNINSAKLNLDAAIQKAEECIQSIEYMIQNGFITEKLNYTFTILTSRQSVNYLFAGNWEKAMYYQKSAVSNALKLKNKYLMLRIAYERCGILLHKSVKNNTERLNQLYNWSLKIPEMQPTEFLLIKAMELVGKLLLFQNDPNQIPLVYNEAKNLDETLKKNNSNYITCTNYLILGTCCLLGSNDTEGAFTNYFKAIEFALDSNREEMLWKCYINTSQLYFYNNYICEAKAYALKCLDIIKKMVMLNPKNRESIYELYRKPIQILKIILPPEDLTFFNLPEKSNIVIETLSVSWKNLTLFLMK